MFKNIHPLFEKKRVLKKEMLENLRDYPRNLFRSEFQDYGNGVLWGCGLSVHADEICIAPGVICFGGIPYILEETLRIACEANGRTSYLKVRFLDKVLSMEQYEYLSQICLDEKAPREDMEIELARFKLQPGARLRDTYTDFYDYHTEFDTLDRTNALYAAPGKHSIWPQILKCFGDSLMKYAIQNPWDYAFCLNCMQLKDAMPYDGIKAYLNVRLKQDREYTNADIYEALKQILMEAGGQGAGGRAAENRERKLLLL